jgi:prevent-host-death family protein
MEAGSMKTMQLRDAKAQLSEVVEVASKGEPVTITRHGTELVMVVPVAAGRTLYPTKKSIVDILMEFPGDDLDLERDHTPPREIDL